MGPLGRSVRVGARRAWRRAAGAMVRPPVILMYHRIAEDPLDPWALCVSPVNFAAQLEVLRRRRRPLPLATLVSMLKGGRYPRGAAVVTFDDGYRDNLEVALPRLEAADVPATVFCTAGYIGGARPFWWDRLAALLLVPDRLPEHLELGAGESARHWLLGAAALYSEADRALDRRVRTTEATKSPRLRFFHDVWLWLKALNESDRNESLSRIAACLEAQEAVETGSPLSHQQAKVLAGSSLIEIGAHTLTHAALSSLPAAIQHHEIAESKARLEEMLNRPVLSFAYPFGDYGPKTRDLVRAAGFQSSCTTERTAVSRSVDLYALPRVAVGDWDGDTFSRTLEGIA